MWRCKIRTSFDPERWHYVSQEEWLDLLLQGEFSPKAPKSWVKGQWDQEGRPAVAAYSIWAKYSLARKWAIWQLADEEDARAAGYLT